VDQKGDGRLGVGSGAIEPEGDLEAGLLDDEDFGGVDLGLVALGVADGGVDGAADLGGHGLGTFGPFGLGRGRARGLEEAEGRGEGGEAEEHVPVDMHRGAYRRVGAAWARWLAEVDDGAAVGLRRRQLREVRAH